MKFKNLIFTKFTKSKYWVCLLLLFLGIISTLLCGDIVIAESSTSNDVIKNLTSSVNDILEGINFSNIEELVKDLNTADFFHGSIKNKVQAILSGEYFTNYNSIISAILSIFFIDVRKFLPFLFTILAIGILSNLISEFKIDNNGTGDVIHIVTLSVLIIVILYVFKDILSVTSNTLNNLLNQIQVIFPILIALLTAIGSFSTISIYNPLVAVLTTIVSIVFDKLLYPIFILIFIISILSSLTNTIKLDKLKGFVASSFKWIIGIIFTLFTGFLSIQGISAGKFDSVSIKATKFAVKSYIPIIGSYISDGMDFIVLGSVLVKNTIGLIGILILFISIISPIISMLIIKLGLQLCSGILEMCGNSKISSFVSDCSKILIYPIVLILGVAFMYTITIALIMCTANIF